MIDAITSRALSNSSNAVYVRPVYVPLIVASGRILIGILNVNVMVLSFGGLLVYRVNAQGLALLLQPVGLGCEGGFGAVCRLESCVNQDLGGLFDIDVAVGVGVHGVVSFGVFLISI